MKNQTKKLFKLLTDILMITTFIFTLISLSFTNKIVHEISGFITIPLVVFHLALNFNWIKGITKNLFKRKLKRKVIVQYVLFIFLTVFFIAVIITGILTSSVINSDVVGAAHRRHTISSIVLIALIATHILWHLRYIKALFFKKKKTNDIKKAEQ